MNFIMEILPLKRRIISCRQWNRTLGPKRRANEHACKSG